MSADLSIKSLHILVNSYSCLQRSFWKKIPSIISPNAYTWHFGAEKVLWGPRALPEILRLGCKCNALGPQNIPNRCSSDVTSDLKITPNKILSWNLLKIHYNFAQWYLCDADEQFKSGSDRDILGIWGFGAGNRLIFQKEHQPKKMFWGPRGEIVLGGFCLKRNSLTRHMTCQ